MLRCPLLAVAALVAALRRRTFALTSYVGMYTVTPEQFDKLRRAIHEHDYLHRILRRIEQLHRVVFHDRESDWKDVRALAEDILIADLVTRHKGGIDGVFYKLREIENGGRDWKSAIDEYAAYIHNYYTTPLGALLRKDVIGGVHQVPLQKS